MDKYAFIDEYRSICSVCSLCPALNVSSSSYYQSKQGKWENVSHKYFGLLFKLIRNTLLSGLILCDITYIKTAQGWLYLAIVKDLCTKNGYAFFNRIDSNRVCDALRQNPPNNLSFLSDRGSQYITLIKVCLVKAIPMITPFLKI